MKLLSAMGLTILCVLPACDSGDKSQKVSDNLDSFSLTQAEKAAGWELLFDGKSLEGWHSYLEESAQGWLVEGGELLTKGGNGDLVTDEVFENFELELEWKISEKGNSGIIYLVDEKPENPSTYMTGPEYQIIDDINYPAKLAPAQKSGANYALHPPMIAASNPVGTFNLAKISVINGKVEHWLNGKKVVSYELGTPEWEAIVDTTKFAKVPVYGRSKKGRIALQDHGGHVAFRNIRIRRK